MGRSAAGVRGISLRSDDRLVGMCSFIRDDAAATLITVCARGYGKRTALADYPTKNRGGKGVITIKTSERNGKVVNLRIVTDEDDLMLITNGGKLIRMPVNGIPTIGRNTQGVRLIRLEPDEQVVAMERIAEKEEGDTEVSPEVAAARLEAQAEPLAEEDLGEEAASEDDEAVDDDEPGDDEGGDAGGNGETPGP
jgi:DNA gyrase subunit A